MSTVTSTSLFPADMPITSSTVSGSQNTQSASNSPDTLASESTFLKLLVAQLKNQDPDSPTDPTQFVGQLTQYSELEQLMQINSGIKGLTSTTDPTTPTTGSTSNPSTTGGI